MPSRRSHSAAEPFVSHTLSTNTIHFQLWAWSGSGKPTITLCCERTSSVSMFLALLSSVPTALFALLYISSRHSNRTHVAMFSCLCNARQCTITFLNTHPRVRVVRHERAVHMEEVHFCAIWYGVRVQIFQHHHTFDCSAHLADNNS